MLCPGLHFQAIPHMTGWQGCRPTSVVEQQCEVIEFLQRRCHNLAQALLRLQTEQDRRVLGPSTAALPMSQR